MLSVRYSSSLDILIATSAGFISFFKVLRYIVFVFMLKVVVALGKARALGIEARGRL